MPSNTTIDHYMERINVQMISMAAILSNGKHGVAKFSSKSHIDILAALLILF